MSDQLEIAVDRDTCISAGFCAASAPDRFEMDEEFRSRVIQSPTTDDQPLRDALESCPVEAIRATDPATGAVVFPPE